mgnify:CR=1 FL=1
MAVKSAKTGVPQIYIKMVNQSYVGMRVQRKSDGTPVWLHQVQIGYDPEKNPTYKEQEDVGHNDSKSYQRREGVLELPMGRPIKLHADISAGLVASGQAEWCDEENAKAGNNYEEIMAEFTPEHLKDQYAATAEALA